MPPKVHPALDHIEKTLADAYRKEIDQEENIWRSLPFFAATIALQLASLFQLIERLPPTATAWGKAAAALLGASGLATLTALCFLAASIYPRKFDYPAPETELLAYAEGLIEDERAAEQGGDDTFDALDTLKRALARQYAVAATNNRQRNKRRERLRSVAGLATVLSVLLTLLLVAATFVYYVPHRNQEHGHEPGQAAGAQPSGAQVSAGAATGPADAGRHQGMVDDA
jgi:hypothetical protein